MNQRLIVAGGVLLATTDEVVVNLDRMTYAASPEALGTLRNKAASFGTNTTVVQNRQTFTKNMINTLQEGADSLTNADLNEEGAKLLALQTQQSLASNAMSMAVSSDQNVLRLF